MKNKLIILLVLCVLMLGAYFGATNFDRIVLGEGNFGEDPNTTADITLQNDEYISNATDGTVLISGTLSATLAGDTNSFQKTAATNNQKFYDTVSITGVTTSSVFLVSIYKAGQPVAGNLLAWHTISNALVVSRADTSTTNQQYSYLRIK